MPPVGSILKDVGLEVGKPVTYKGKSAKIKQIIVDPVKFDHSIKDDDMDKDKIKSVRLVIRMDDRDEMDQVVDKHVEPDDISY